MIFDIHIRIDESLEVISIPGAEYYKGDKGDDFTYEDFTPEQIEGLKQPAIDAAEEVEALIEVIEGNELSRISAENGRVQAENGRVQAENNRGANELERSQSETTRGQNETTRQQAEITREANEGERITAESERKSAEELRVIAEQNRAAELSAKANHGYTTNPKTLKEVDDSLVQLAGDVNLKELKANKQNSLEVDGTGTKFPTVDAVNLALATKADKNDTLSNTADIRSLENVINSANINQEVTATITGVDTVVLPKTAANTGMKVQLFGESNETSNVLGTGRVRSVGKNLLKINKNYTVSFDGKECIKIASYNTSPYDSTKQGVYVNIATNNAIQYQKIIFNSNTQYTISYRRKNSSTEGTYGSALIIYYSDGTEATHYTGSNGDWVSRSVTSTINKTIKYILFICGGGSHISYVDISTLQIERNTVSTSYEPYRSSSLYLTTPELRSNGLIKDEIRKGTNGYELVKRVGVGTLGGEIINQSNILRQFVTLRANILGTTITTTGAGGVRRISFLNTSKWYKITLNYTADENWEIRQFDTPPLIGLAPGLTAGTNVNLVAFIQSPDGGIYFRNASSDRVITINSMSIKEVSAQDAIANDSTFYEQTNGNVLYKLATSTTTAIPHAGLLNSNSNGTAYFEPIIADAGVYGSNLPVQLPDYPIASFESIRKYANGTYTELNIATAVIAGNGLSFTHPDLVSGDLVMFTYAYNRESIGRSMTLTHYDNRYVKVDTANGKTYRIDFVVTNGVVVPTATEV